MTVPSIVQLRGTGRVRFWTAVEFLTGRTTETETIAWALQLGADKAPERAALVHILRGTRSLPRPWAAAWALVEEVWTQPDPDQHADDTLAFDISQRIAERPLPGNLVALVGHLFRPRLTLASPIRLDDAPRKRPSSVHDLVDASVTGAGVDRIRDVVAGLGQVDDVGFLASAADALEANVRHALHLARRIGWKSGPFPWPCGPLHQVRYIDGADPDQYRDGLAPNVKLLHAAVSRLADLGSPVAHGFLAAWRTRRGAVDVRLWADLASRPDLATPEDVRQFLDDCNAAEFWDVEAYPEVTALRAARFGDLDHPARKATARRIRRLPPRRLWHRDVDPDRLRVHRVRRAVGELQRIVVSGGSLPDPDARWLVERLAAHPDIENITPRDGFPTAPVVEEVRYGSDRRLDELRGRPRLDTLEAALATEPYSPEHGTAQTWLGLAESQRDLLLDLRTDAVETSRHPRVLATFAGHHRPRADQDNGAQAVDMLDLVGRLPEEAVRRCIPSLCDWMASWADQVAACPGWPYAWHRLWPSAAAATNESYDPDRDGTLEPALLADDADPRPVDVIAAPVSGLVHVFLAACPTRDGRNPFADQPDLREVRDTIIDSCGSALLIARARLLAHLPYFLGADRAWTERHLTRPLLAGEDPALWQAVAHRLQPSSVVSRIGTAMAEQCANRALPFSTRESLARTIVRDALEASRNDRAPALQPHAVQQMLRSVDDDLRAATARLLADYMRWVPRQAPCDPEALFRCTVAPFLDGMWRLERHFASAVAAVLPFLTPFDAYGLDAYALPSHRRTGHANLSTVVDDAPKARALLDLLDATTGHDRAPASVDLSAALDHIRQIDRSLARQTAFRRLEALTRG